MTKTTIAVIGAGLMGHGIAQVFALHGQDMTITDTLVVNLGNVRERIAASRAANRVKIGEKNAKMRADLGLPPGSV